MDILDNKQAKRRINFNPPISMKKQRLKKVKSDIKSLSDFYVIFDLFSHRKSYFEHGCTQDGQECHQVMWEYGLNYSYIYFI